MRHSRRRVAGGYAVEVGIYPNGRLAQRSHSRTKGSCYCPSQTTLAASGSIARVLPHIRKYRAVLWGDVSSVSVASGSNLQRLGARWLRRTAGTLRPSHLPSHPTDGPIRLTRPPRHAYHYGQARVFHCLREQTCGPRRPADSGRRSVWNR